MSLSDDVSEEGGLQHDVECPQYGQCGNVFDISNEVTAHRT